MTDRLYYNDPFLRAFDATIVRVADRGGRTTVTLDRTAFYPTSGGQPFDTGALGPWRVVDVVDEDDGTITHVVEPRTRNEERGTEEPRTGAVEPGTATVEPRTPNPEPGLPVHCVVDWARRFDHMQQHTGQHVLSAAFDHFFSARTVSFHLGADTSTIDIARELSRAEITCAEDAANAVVWEDRPVAIKYATAEEAAKLPLRKEPARGGTLRLIDVDNFDLSACGGTHVARTGAIGVIAVAGWERFKGGQRIAFVCGARALRAHRTLRDAITASGRLLSVLPGELAATIERLQAELKDQKRAGAALQTELAAFRAQELAASSETVAVSAAADGAVVKLVARAIAADANGLKSLAAAVAAQPGYVAALTSTTSPALVVIARSSDVGISAQQVLAALVKQFGGKGGGRPELAQAGGLAGSSDDILAAVRAQLG
jgi:alanyl-tRNA synthetase